ncbi:hypothetical protein C8R47DRAFT_1203912, partial [Mycena vitilis]
MGRSQPSLVRIAKPDLESSLSSCLARERDGEETHRGPQKSGGDGEARWRGEDARVESGMHAIDQRTIHADNAQETKTRTSRVIEYWATATRDWILVHCTGARAVCDMFKAGTGDGLRFVFPCGPTSKRAKDKDEGDKLLVNERPTYRVGWNQQLESPEAEQLDCKEKGRSRTICNGSAPNRTGASADSIICREEKSSRMRTTRNGAVLPHFKLQGSEVRDDHERAEQEAKASEQNGLCRLIGPFRPEPQLATVVDDAALAPFRRRPNDPRTLAD